MARIQGLVEGECGGANPLMQLTKAYHTGTQEQFHSYSNHDAVEIVVPQSFDMGMLLEELQKMEDQLSAAKSMAGEVESNWTQEYNHFSKEKTVLYDSPEVKAKTIDDTVGPHFFRPPPRPLMQPPVLASFNSTTQHQNGKWAHEYLDETHLECEGSTQLQRTAKEIIESVEDQQVSATDFMKLMKQLEDGKTLNEETKHVETVEDWVRQYEATGSEDALEAQDLIEPITQGDEEYWNNLRKDWDELFSQERFQTENESFVQGFLSDYSKEYAFEESNPFKGIDNPFEEGLQKLKAGDLISAILLFEEAVMLNPSHAEAWQYLGTSQAENEQETLAIRALNKCIELQPDNATARMALAVSYTNESLQNQACSALKCWIQHHPRYSHLTADGKTSTEVNHGSSLMTPEMFNEVQHLYLVAARLAPAGDIDADIQVGLGVLFNISGDYSKGIDCFNTALQASPKDASVWNKLGATLANSGRSPEAIEAYRNALAIRPGFIRCRYNLGVSCINLKAYNEAIEHLLTALNMQRQGEDKNRVASTMSENIWTTLRMTLSLLGKLDLMKAVTDRDLKTLNEIFVSGS